MDLLAELRGAFASDAVWLTELEPIHGYDPLQALGGKAPAGNTAPNGKSTVKPDFANTKFGASSLADLSNDGAAEQPRGRRQASNSKAVTANAVRIKGFWRENPRSQNIVSDLLKNLREKSNSFRFFIPEANNSKVTIDLLDDRNLGRIMTITAVSAKSGDLAQSFEITLPLAREVAIK
jgi:hypothetical protein